MKARVALLSLLAFVAAACSNGSSGGGDNTAATPPLDTPTATASTTPSATPSASPKPTPSFSSTVQASHRCQTAQLSLSIGQGQGAAGSTIVPIVLTNKGSDGCTLFGRPGVSFLDANGNQLGVGASFGGSEPATVTLAPNGSANALLQMPDPGNFAPADCNQAMSTRLAVIPPNDKTSLTVAYSTEVCTTKQGAASVSPVTPGAGE
ncbi:MAG TPA: DUF4232 domain-containing protein [Mycobacteriales bacterium]|nr:DUF4232 domain-containing protein [Mycobacteriales bacterium]